MELTKTFTPAVYAQALESWTWLDLDGKTPVFSSLFGDVFLQASTGEWWYLDTLAGTIDQAWANRDDMMKVLATEIGEDHFLMGGLARAARDKGLLLTENQVYDFMPPPILGGDLVAENIIAQDVVLTVNIAGQIHDQVRHLPPGTPITKIELA
jgi:hypothetical protein